MRLLDLATMQEQGVLPGQDREVLSGSFSPDGTLLAVGGRESFSVVVDLTDARHVVTLPSHRADVRSVAFSPDGSLIASVGDDCAVRLWSPRTASFSEGLCGTRRPSVGGGIFSGWQDSGNGWRRPNGSRSGLGGDIARRADLTPLCRIWCDGFLAR